MTYISNSVGIGGKNLMPDVKIIQWMLIRAQNNYSSVIFGPCYDIKETGTIDAATDSAIKALIRYVKKVSNNNSLLKPPETIFGTAYENINPFRDSVIFPDDENYEYLLKCTLKPVCVTPDGKARVGFHTDSLVAQALAGRINFQGFKAAVITKDGDTCGDSNLKVKKRKRNYSGKPQKLSDAEIASYKKKAKRGERFNEAIIWELPENNPGYVVYNRNDVAIDGLDQIGTKETIEAIIKFASDWISSHENPDRRKLQIGDISRPGGLDTSQHRGHENGRIVDIRPLRKDNKTGKWANLNYRSVEYDQGLTKTFFRFVKKRHPNIKIRFNDPSIAGKGEFTYVRKDSGGTVHDNHYHLEF